MNEWDVFSENIFLFRGKGGFRQHQEPLSQPRKAMIYSFQKNLVSDTIFSKRKSLFYNLVFAPPRMVYIYYKTI